MNECYIQRTSVIKPEDDGILHVATELHPHDVTGLRHTVRRISPRD